MPPAAFHGGRELLQVYTRSPDVTVPAPRLRLGAFTRVHLKAGASRTVTLVLTPQTRAVVLDGEASAKLRSSEMRTSRAGHAHLVGLTRARPTRAQASGDAVYAASASQQVEPGRLQVRR